MIKVTNELIDGLDVTNQTTILGARYGKRSASKWWSLIWNKMKNNFHKLFTYSTKLTESFYAGPMFYPDMEYMPGDDGEWTIFLAFFKTFCDNILL